MALLSRAGRRTGLIVLAVTAGLIVWDVALLQDAEADNTISAVFRITSRILGIPYAFGILAGHVFWHQEGPRDDALLKQKISTVSIIGVAISIAALAMDDLHAIAYLCARPHWIFAAGFVSGHWAWPQYRDEVGA